MLTRYGQVIITNYLTGQDRGQYAPPRQRPDGGDVDHSHHDHHPHDQMMIDTGESLGLQGKGRRGSWTRRGGSSSPSSPKSPTSPS